MAGLGNRATLIRIGSDRITQEYMRLSVQEHTSINTLTNKNLKKDWLLFFFFFQLYINFYVSKSHGTLNTAKGVSKVLSRQQCLSGWN